MTLPPTGTGARAMTQQDRLFTEDEIFNDTQPQGGHELTHTVQQSGSPTSAAEQAAEQQGTDADPDQDTQPCRGWVELYTHYAEFDHIPISGRITLSKVEEGGGLTQISQDQVDYERIAGDVEVFVAPRPRPRPEGLGEEQEGEEPATEDTADGTDPDMEAGEPTSQAQMPATAAANGNARILLGGEEGLEPGTYRVAFQPTIRHGKLRVHPRAITAAEDAALEHRYKIIPTDGVVPDTLTEANTTDRYYQVPGTTTVEEEWSQDVNVMCMPRNMPFRVEMVWTDFKANPFQNNRSEGRLRTLHPKARHTFFCFVNKCEEVDREYVVLSGLRGPAEQDELYCHGRATEAYCVNLGFTAHPTGWRTNAKRWRSNHNYGVAIDMQDFNADDWVNQGIPSQMAGTVGDQFGLEWGGRWTDSRDYPHFQLSTPSWRALRDQVTNGVVAEARRLTYDGNEYVSF
ncbi:M15 family metallopeptidase [Litoreibacter arenae]|uniref:Peptidase M15B and M15C n=1 Tax=Litoreibacter arenae DSM 19593 TaxID=1123360 RepID=S9Q762_9RHOB|nr:M15 family metallopeptidase [Litoreibacter arenae]EPX77211.1 Peptidase M15B and M15C [Litoreibacter arenae DSM 19593]